MKEKSFLSVVVYSYNNQDCIIDQLLNLNAYLQGIFETIEFVIVDDASCDNTIRELLQSQSMPNLTVVKLSRRHGLELAMTAGLEKAMGDFVIEIDSIPIDFDFVVFDQMLEASKSGNDIVSLCPLGHKSLRSRIFFSLINRFSYLSLDSSKERARLVSRRALNSMLKLKEKVRYRKALYSYTGYRKKAIEYQPIFHSKLYSSTKESVTLAVDVAVSFSNLGLRISHYLSFIFFAMSLCAVGYGVLNFLFNRHVVPGWTTLFVLTAVGFSGVFLVVGIIGEYLARILLEVQNRPLYTVAEIHTISQHHNDSKSLVAAAIENTNRGECDR